MPKCSTCNRTKRPGLFSYRKTICNTCYKRSPAYTAQRDRYLRTTYGITAIEYDLLLQTFEGRCWICDGKSGGKHLAVDHNHTNGRVRGLLCKNCNSILARIRNRPEVARNMELYLQSDGGGVRLTLGRQPIVPDTPGEV